MCLTKVISKEKEEIEGEGWKVVQVSPKPNEFMFPYFDSNTSQPFNSWLYKKFIVNDFFKPFRKYEPTPNMIAIQADPTDTPTDYYPTGFHVFNSLQAAETYQKINHMLILKPINSQKIKTQRFIKCLK